MTLDELGDAWQAGKLHLPLYSYINNQLLGKPNAGQDMQFHFGQLIAHAAKTRRLSAGTIIGSGTISNVAEDSGSSCLAEERMLEIIEHGEAKTNFMRFGDVVKIEMRNQQGQNIFGTIEQRIVAYSPS